MPPGYFPAPTKPTRLVGPDGTPLTGDITLTPGIAQVIQRQGNGYLFGASNNQRARGVECFFPGVLAARAGLIVPVPDAVLSSLDVMLRVAPAATDGANFAQVRVKGVNPASNSVALPLQTNALAEYHLGMADLSPVIGTAGGSNQGGPKGLKGYGISFHPTTNVTIGGLAVNACDLSAYSGAGAMPPESWPLRVGIADATITGASGHTPNTIPWVKDSLGNLAYVDVPQADTYASNAAGPSYPWTPVPFPAVVNLVAGTTYRVMAIGGPNATQVDTAHGMTPLSESSGFGSAGNIVMDAAFVLATGNAQANPATAVFTERHTVTNPFAVRFLGSVLGTALSGFVSIGVEITGAPATPGTDLMLSCQL